MKTKYLILGISVFILCLTLVSAEYSYVFEKDMDSSLHISCFDTNNSHCLSGTNCQISIYYPNQTAMAVNQSMTYSPTYFDYDITTSVLGEHSVIVTCRGSTNAYSTFNYLVTPTGIEAPGSSSVILASIIIIIFGISCFFLVLAFKLQTAGVKIFFFLASFIFLIGSLGTAMVVGFDSNISSGVTSITTVMLYAIGLITFMVFAFILVKQILAALDMMRQKKGYETGF